MPIMAFIGVRISWADLGHKITLLSQQSRGSLTQVFKMLFFLVEFAFEQFSRHPMMLQFILQLALSTLNPFGRINDTSVERLVMR